MIARAVPLEFVAKFNKRFPNHRATLLRRLMLPDISRPQNVGEACKLIGCRSIADNFAADYTACQESEIQFSGCYSSIADSVGLVQVQRMVKHAELYPGDLAKLVTEQCTDACLAGLREFFAFAHRIADFSTNIRLQYVDTPIVCLTEHLSIGEKQLRCDLVVAPGTGQLSFDHPLFDGPLPPRFLTLIG